MAKDTPKRKELPKYLADMRKDLIVQLGKTGLSTQNIADIFSIGITKGGVHQIIAKTKINKDESGS